MAVKGKLTKVESFGKVHDYVIQSHSQTLITWWKGIWTQQVIAQRSSIRLLGRSHQSKHDALVWLCKMEPFGHALQQHCLILIFTVIHNL